MFIITYTRVFRIIIEYKITLIYIRIEYLPIEKSIATPSTFHKL